MKIFFFALLGTIMVCGASDPHKAQAVFTLKDFRKTINLSGRAIVLPGVERPCRLTILPDKGVIMFYEADYRSTKKWIHFYSLDSIKFIRSVIGNGASDGQLLGAFQLQYDKRNGGEIYITDVIKQQIIVYKADSLIAGNETPFKMIGKPFNGNRGLDVNTERLMRSVILDDHYTIVDTRTGGSNHSRMLLNKYRNDLSVKDSFGTYPKTTEEIPPHLLGQVLDGCLSISDNNKFLVFNGLTTDYLSVYDTSGKIVASAIGPGEVDVNYKTQKVGGGERIISASGHNGYGSRAQIIKGLVYVLYDGKDSKDHDEHVTDLFQFNTRLIPEVRYKFNLPVFDFQIDFRTRRLYGLRREGSTPQMVIYQL